MEVKINAEAVAIIAQKVLELNEAGLHDSLKDAGDKAVDKAVEIAKAMIEENQELNNIEIAKLVKNTETTEQRSSTWLIDMARRSQAIRGGDQKLVEELTEKTSANSGTTTLGGYLAPTENAYELIDLVNKDSIMLGFGRKVPMRSNTLTFPTLTAGTVAYSFAEATTSGSGGTTDAPITTSFLTLTAFAYGVQTTISNELLQDSDPSIEAVIRSDITRQIASYIDWSVFHGNNTVGLDGANSLMSGLEGDDIIVTNKNSAGGAPSFDDILALKKPQDNTMAPLQVIMHPGAERALSGVKDNVGRYIYDPTVRSAGTPMIWSMPVSTTNRISTTLGQGAETAIFAGAFNDSMYWGTKPNFEVIFDPFTYAGNSQVRLVSIFRVAMNVTHENHFSMLDGVTL